MVPRHGKPQVLPLQTLAEARAVMKEARVSAPGINIMEKKGVFRVVRVRDLELRAANILKQEMLARGGEAAISREVFEWRGQRADCVIMGTLAQFERLIEKLRLQPFGLRALAASIQTALDNYDQRIPESALALEPAELPLLMGVLNVTPDSFSDGGDFAGLEAAVEQAHRLVEEGAALIDVGGESTRPGADPVDTEEELKRVLPVVKALAPELPGRISVDTYKARVAAEALAEGAYMVNDISALRMDPEMVAVVRDADCPVVLMHMLGTPKTMQENPQYENVVADIYDFFVERLNWAVDQGIKESNLLIDPGIGFGKTTAHNLEILRNLAAFRSLGRPIVIGASRKRFLGEILGIAEPKDRDVATAFTSVMAALAGAHVVRVHNVAVNRDAVRLARAVGSASLG